MNGGFAAMYHALYERPARAKPILQTLRDLAHGAEPSTLLVITIGQAEATCSWLEGDNERCVAFVREALAIAARTGVFVWNDYLLGLGVGAYLGLEDFGAVQELLQPMADIARRRGGFPVSTYHGHASWDAQDRGDALSAWHHAELGHTVAEKEGPPFGHTIALILLAQAQWMAGRPGEAAAALARATNRAKEAASVLLLHTCYLIESDLFWDEDRTRALTCLRQSFGYAAEGGYYNAIALNRRTLERGVVRALEHGVAVEYVLARIRKNGLRPAGLPPRLEIWPWRYRFRLFGSLDVVAGDEGLPSGKGPFVLRGMPRRLLEALLVFGGRGVRDVQIIDALWPDADGDAGRRVFDTTLHRLRRQLGDADLLRMNDGRLSLDERSCWLDTWAFDDLAAEAERQSTNAGPASSLVDLARRIVAIYRGPVLADEVAGSPWAARSRERYANKFLQVTQSLGHALEQAGKASEAAIFYSRANDNRIAGQRNGEKARASD
jgi:hypothetical protein